MEIVELRVQVEKSQLDALQAQVEALKKTTINLGVGRSGKGGDPTQNVRNGLKATENQANKTGQSIMSVMGKVAKWTAVTTAVYAPIKAFKEALTTIKALDTEMVNVQKVTGATAAQMKKYQDQAYALASQYGRNALDVAESMTAFARAGYGDQIDQMAELSTLLQNVGYVSADTANSMLLAVDAAWHLNGSQTELMAVLDGVDKITNQNATDFEKMARGMTVAASVFAESGESIQTFASMVGTGTAVTQRSGEEISRGLRTIMMNIRQIKGETEDGELIDGESIAKASAALKEFAGISTMENGELRKGSEVLSDLAAKWKDLDSVQQSAIAEALAGKRQANILTALMGNWEMYEKQMEEYATAAGTALKENEIYMDSWAAKSEQLKSKWTEFVSHFVETDAIKGALDGLIGTLEFLDSDFGQLTIKATAFTAALFGISKAVMAISGTAVFRDIAAFISLLSTEGIAAFGALMPVMTTLAAIMALGADFAFMAKSVDDAFVSFEEQKDVVADLTAQYEQLTGAGSEYAQLLEKVNSSDDGVSALTERERNRLTVLTAQADALERQLHLEQQIAFEKFKQKDAGTYQLEHGEMVDTGVGQKGDEKRLEKMNKLYEEGIKSVQAGESSLQDYRDTLQGIISDNAEWYDQMLEWQDLGFGDQFSEADKQAMELYETISKLLSLGDEDLPIVTALDKFEADGIGFTTFAQETVVNASKLRQQFEDLGLSAEDAQNAIDGLRADGVIVIDVEKDGIDTTLTQLEELGLAVKDADGWKVNIEGLKELADDIGLSSTQAEQLALAFDQLDGVSLVDAKGEVVSLLDSVSELGTKSPMDLLVGASTDKASKKLTDIGNKADAVEKKDPVVTVKAVDNASSTLNSVSSLISALNGKIATVKVVASQKSNPSGYVPTSILRSAEGDTNFKGGPVLLGDELSASGAPRPELVITKGGKAYLAGTSGPVATTLPAGSRIFNYDETQKILSGTDMLQLIAYAGGNGLGGLSLSDRYLRGTGGGGSNAASTSNASSGGGGGTKATKSGGTTKSGSGGSSKSGGSGSSSSAKAEEDAYLEQLKKELELLQAQYSYLEASNASTGELRDKSTEIQGKLHDINERLRETGGEEKDIVDNSTAWWQEIDKQKETLEKELSLLRAEYDYLEASGASTDELNKKSKQIQDKLHEINETLRAVNGSQEEITENSTAWFEELKKIQDAQIEVYEKERDLLQSEADLMSKDGTRPDVRIAKMREIQDCLHRQAEYMRSIKASQAEINQLSIQWWEIQNDILAIQQDLVDELNNAINAKLKLARKERDAELKLIDEQISKLQEERDIQQDQLDIEEKRKAVTEARIALENAQRQRTVRYYNAATGQWEWAADAKNVASARKTYEQAQKDYQQEQRDREYDLRIKELELQKEDINNRYDLLESRWENLSESFETPLRSIEDILRDLLATGTLSNEQVALVKELVGDIDGYTLAILKTLLSYAEYQTVNGPATGKEYAKYVVEWLKENGWTEENVAKAWEEVRVASATEGNGAAAAYFAAAQANAAAEAIKTASGNKTTNNYAPSANDSAAVKAAKAAAETAAKAKSSSSSSSSASSSSSSTKYSTSATGTSSSGGTYTIESSKGLNFVNNAKSGETMTGGDGSTWTKNKDGSTTIKKNGTTYTVYDEGGVLSGLGGIKATMEDEIVIPPDIAKFMLNPSANQQFKRRMAELGYLYGTGSLASTNLVGSMQKLASNDHYGDVYNYGNISLTENQARSMTVYELAQKSRSLSVYSAS